MFPQWYRDNLKRVTHITDEAINRLEQAVAKKERLQKEQEILEEDEGIKKDEDSTFESVDLRLDLTIEDDGFR